MSTTNDTNKMNKQTTVIKTEELDIKETKLAKATLTVKAVLYYDIRQKPMKYLVISNGNHAEDIIINVGEKTYKLVDEMVRKGNAITFDNTKTI